MLSNKSLTQSLLRRFSTRNSLLTSLQSKLTIETDELEALL
jgi:thiosulfate/3-mercaptopyruvate sulfurtransferase